MRRWEDRRIERLRNPIEQIPCDKKALGPPDFVHCDLSLILRAALCEGIHVTSTDSGEGNYTINSSCSRKLLKVELDILNHLTIELTPRDIG